MVKLEELITYLEQKYNIAVFNTDIKRDELRRNSSFFMFNDKGEITKNVGSVHAYTRSFYLMFITREDRDIDEIELIESVKKYGLIFSRTEIDYGKIESLDQEAKMITFVFHTPVKVCY